MGDLYPDMPPALPGETDDQYTDRLTGADGTGRVPYDHVRNRQCSIGYHHECSERGAAADGRRCRCPCHSEADQPRDPTAGVAMHIGATRPQDPAADTGAPGSQCPCAGRCHHDTSPCSLGCWAAQKPWLVEEAAAAGDAEVRRLAQLVRRHWEHTGSLRCPDPACGCDIEMLTQITALAASQPSAAAAQGPGIDVERLARAMASDAYEADPTHEDYRRATRVAAEYARLAAAQPSAAAQRLVVRFGRPA